jgi:multiple antibiotic resistance protein
MIFGLSKPEQEIEMAEKSHQETAIFPLAVPSIAGPGPMLAAVLLTDNSRYNFMQQFQTILIMLSVLVIVMILMLAAARIHRIIGSGGASVISKVMGMILASVAAESVLDGIKDYFLI